MLKMVVQVNKEEKRGTKIMLTKPLQFAKESADSEETYKAPSLLQRLLSLFKNVRPGSDLTNFQVSNIFFFSSLLFFFIKLDLFDEYSNTLYSLVVYVFII